jgi:hypothetical protein
MTANQALLLIVYHFYGCPVNYFVMVQTFIYSYTHVDQIFGATQKLKNQRQKKECLEYFLILKPKYVEQVLTNHHFVHNTTNNT